VLFRSQISYRPAAPDARDPDTLAELHNLLVNLRGEFKFAHYFRH
jgi:hypothetical protein